MSRPGSPPSRTVARSWPPAETIAEAGTVTDSDARTATVKGVSAPVTFAAVTWA